MSSIVIAEHQQTDISAIESVIAKGDLSQLDAQERVDYYINVCRSLGLNPFTKPFDYLNLKGKITLYATRGATDQLRDRKHVNVVAIDREIMDGLCIVTCTVELPDGRRDTSTGIVALGNLAGEDRANAIMKAETKAKRRATLSICGLSWMDETEVETVAGARRAREYTTELADHGVIDAATVNQGDFDTPRRNRDVAGAVEATPAQMNYMHRLADEKGWHHADLHDCAASMFGVESLTELSRQQASQLIERVHSGPKWVDPRQQRLDVPIDVEGRELPVEPKQAPVSDNPYWDADGRLIRWTRTGEPALDVADALEAAKAATTPGQMTELRRFVKEMGLGDDDELHGTLVARHKELSGNGQ